MIHYNPQQTVILANMPLESWVCHDTLKRLMWNEHKRRGEILEKGEFGIEVRKCTHGIKRTFDYLRYEKNRRKEEKSLPLKVEVEPVAARLF